MAIIGTTNNAKMNEMPSLPERKHPSHPPPVLSSTAPVLLFVTVCTFHRRPLLANNQAHDLVRSIWQQADHFKVGRYILMPDHLHLFCSPGAHDVVLSKWMAFWRNATTRAWPNADEKPVWQRDYWDRQVRRDEQYGEKWAYVRNNPVRAGLVQDPDEWPYQGEVHVLRW